MLKPCFAMSESEALAVLSRTGVFRIAGMTEDGPLLRTVDGVVHDGMLCFHGADRGTKLELVGREVMVAGEEVVAHLPSWFFDERRACPATTYYRSVYAWGTIERVADRVTKAAVLQALMEHHQPEGRHQPITADDPLYANAIDGLFVGCIRPRRIEGKAKLGQHKGAATIARALDGLWQRGAPGDLAAIRAVREAHPGRPTPTWMLGPVGVTFEVAPDGREVEAAVALLEGQYWNEGVEPRRIRSAHLASPAWIVARDPAGTVVATARAVGDDAKIAIVYDVVVDPALRGRGLGRAMVGLLLQHPRVRGARRVLLRTRDAQGFYTRLGFSPYVSSNELLGRTTS
ncbi:GNAT family N-acetyltransferase [Paraliomyxa miuraensis]|uniref:GNAT family N-acetyltransferase n=1 Tax=Paraliomyxa miuraensis TaxID=376150 RepID=UPI002255530B|nr:GNAT family N-acetyltransferase [Paraliomyxa miuraensis]MCX4243779.1 GNAT family N-acetyltransferase [Paraliomyxa miuraensis]